MPRAQPSGVSPCRPWKQFWGRDGIPRGCSTQGNLLLAWPRRTLSLPLPRLRLPAREGSRCGNRSQFLVFHALEEKPWAGTWTQTYWHLQGFAEKKNFYQALCRFSRLQLIHRSVVSLLSSATRIKVSTALLSFQNNNHN